MIKAFLASLNFRFFFSAVDQHVSKRLFQECIRGLLKNSTVILVTHQLQYLSQCDFILFLDKGLLKGSGTYDELLRGNSDFNSLIKTHVGRRSETQENRPQVAQSEAKNGAAGEKPKNDVAAKGAASGALIMAEDKSIGNVS